MSGSASVPGSTPASATGSGAPSAESTAATRWALPAGTRRPAQPPPPGSTPTGATAARRRRMLVSAGLGVVALLVASGVAYAQLGRDDDKELTGGGATASASATVQASPTPTTPADELCTAEIKSNKRWVCLTSAVVADGKITINYDVAFAGSKPNVKGGYHLHIYGGDGTYPPDHEMGSHYTQSKQHKWYVEDRRPSVLDTDDDRYTTAIGEAKKVCARIALAGHGLVPDNNSTYRTGNCIPIKRS